MIHKYLRQLGSLSLEKKIDIYNDIVKALQRWLGIEHPVLGLQLIPLDRVRKNDYNPNKVAPPEMRLLRTSIQKDGMTMPVVVARSGDAYEIVDGFHRTTVIRSTESIRESLHGYLPVTLLDKSIEDRITATVRHNMARGTHQVELSAKLIATLKKHDWTDATIGMELGMDADEVLRLKQITGLAEAFADRNFSRSWNADSDARDEE